MSKLEIIKGKDNPILRAKSEPVIKIDSSLKKFAKDMHKAMIKANGLGIAAPQVGRNIRIFIATLNYKEANEMVVYMVNPEILSHSEETEVEEEGCLSLPGDHGKVERWREVTVRFQDLNGDKHTLTLEGLNARVFQHENDHLDGVLFIDKLVN